MQSIITLEILSGVSENGFSLDELVIATRLLFEEKGMAGFVGLILDLMDERICMEMVRGTRASGKPCCAVPRYSHHDRLSRQFRTSAGTVSIRWRRLKCLRCGKTILPLRNFLGLEPHRSMTGELEKIVAEVVSEQSYRRSSSDLGTIGQIPVRKSTAHRWIAQSHCDTIEEHKDKLDILFADGTGYKKRPTKKGRGDNRGELRVALGVNKSGQIVPLGAFSGLSWDEIASIVKGDRRDGEHVADMLVSDGEYGLRSAMGKICGAGQRCHWHLVHDMNGVLLADQVGIRERRKTQKRLAAIIGLELPAEDIEQVKDSDRSAILTARNHADKEVRKLIKKLVDKAYYKAADYLIYAKNNMFSYVDRWLQTGIVSPRVSSFIERMMRELARRLKRMAFGWSQEGAAKMARIIIKRFTSANQWENYWKNRLNIKGNVILSLIRIYPSSPQMLGR
jgi:hypothetical protein